MRVHHKCTTLILSHDLRCDNARARSAACGVGYFSTDLSDTACVDGRFMPCPAFSSKTTDSPLECVCDQYYSATSPLSWDNVEGTWSGVCEPQYSVVAVENIPVGYVGSMAVEGSSVQYTTSLSSFTGLSCGDGYGSEQVTYSAAILPGGEAVLGGCVPATCLAPADMDGRSTIDCEGKSLNDEGCNVYCADGLCTPMLKHMHTHILHERDK